MRRSRLFILLLFLTGITTWGQKVDPYYLGSGERVLDWRNKLNSNATRFNDSIYNYFQLIQSLQSKIAVLEGGAGGGGSTPPDPNGGTPVVPAIAGYDSTYAISVKQKFAIPENVSNGDYVGVWLKTVTWRSGYDVSFSIEKNHNNAFAIDDYGVITVADASQINGKVVQQDTVIQLLIRSTDAGYGYEIDTAEIKVKENSYCKFIDYSYASTSTGTRSQPYKDLGDATITAGYGYFVKRGNSTSGKYYSFSGQNTGSYTHPTIIGVYGSGNKPIFDGAGLSGPDAVINLLNTPVAWTYMNIYDWDVRNYPEHAFRINSPAFGIGIHNMKFSGNVRLSESNGLADVYFYGSETDTAASAQKYLQLWNSESEGSLGPILKSDACGVSAINIKSHTASHLSGKAFNVRINTTYSYLKHFWLEGGVRSLQIQFHKEAAIDGVIIGAEEAGIFVQTNAGSLPPNGVIIDNVCFRNNVDGMYFYSSGITGWQVKNCYFHNNSSDGIYFFNGQTSAKLLRNKFIGNGGAGITFSKSSAGSVGTEIYYNVFSGNNSGALVGTVSGCASNMKLYNNTINGTTNLSGSTGTVARNNFYNGTFSGIATSSNNLSISGITTGDYFVNYAGDNFKLKSTAVNAIDKGYYVGVSPDINGVSVPQNSLTDIGAYEYK